MRITSVRLQNFKRFHDLTIEGIPPAKLVVLVGPNGSGKTSLFDGFRAWLRSQAALNVAWDSDYYERTPWKNSQLAGIRGKELELSTSKQLDKSALEKLFYFRTAYRNDPDFTAKNLTRVGKSTEDIRFRRMIDSDAAVSDNYSRLVSQAIAELFIRDNGNKTVTQFREKILSDIREPLNRIFPELVLNDFSDPLSDGTFRFRKGQVDGFVYKNLSAGEKAAFDLILDLVVKRRDYDDTIFCIDEPEAHMNTRLQGALLQELYGLIPNGSQLWIATHSIGMMRKSRELFQANPDEVIFLDFGGQDFDRPVTLSPAKPTRTFWEGVLNVALDDLASLVAPRELVLCEGNPAGAVKGKNAEFDACCYETIFGDEFPDVKFVSVGSSKEVAGDRLALAAVFPKVITGIAVRRVIDGDDHSQQERDDYRRQGIQVLTRRHIESYLYDNEVLEELCAKYGQQDAINDVIEIKKQALTETQKQGYPDNDVKSAAGLIYNGIKKRLRLISVGNDTRSFARDTLAPLIKSETSVYQELKAEIFGDDADKLKLNSSKATDIPE